MLLKSAKISAEVRFGLSNRHLSISVAIIREFFGLRTWASVFRSKSFKNVLKIRVFLEL